MTDLELILGDKNLSSWSLRAWLVLRLSGATFNERLVPFSTPRWREIIAELSPARRVPALHHGDLVVWDSLAIAEYVAELFPEARLWPDDPRARATARAVSAEMHSGFAALRRELPMDVTARHPPRMRSAATENDVRRLADLLSRCRDDFGDGGPYLFGRPSIADAMFAPIAFRFRTYGVEVREPAARAWLETMLAHPSMLQWERAAQAEVAANAGRAPLAPHPSSAEEVFAVVFSSHLAAPSAEYDELARTMDELARSQPGFLGMESARGADGFGITVSFWSSLEAIRAWREHPEHRAAQARGREAFYHQYEIRICEARSGYRFPDRQVTDRRAAPPHD
jgi:glutathione S-transferase